MVIAYLSDVYSYWSFFTPDMGSSINFCKDAEAGELEASGNIKVVDPPYPDGTKKLDFKIHDMEDCVYEGTSDEPGTFTCPQLGKTVDCESYGDSKVHDCYGALSVSMFNPVVRCQWY